MVMTNRRALARQKIREGWDRLALEHPEINWTTTDSPEVEAAEIRVADAVRVYENGGGLAGVRIAFDGWAAAQIEHADKKEKADEGHRNSLSRI